MRKFTLRCRSFLGLARLFTEIRPQIVFQKSNYKHITICIMLRAARGVVQPVSSGILLRYGSCHERKSFCICDCPLCSIVVFFPTPFLESYSRHFQVFPSPEALENSNRETGQMMGQIKLESKVESRNKAKLNMELELQCKPKQS